MALMLAKPMVYAACVLLVWTVFVSHRPWLTGALALFWSAVNIAISHWINAGRERPSRLHDHTFAVRGSVNAAMLVSVTWSAGPASSAWIIGVAVSIALSMHTSASWRLAASGLCATSVALGLGLGGADPETLAMAVLTVSVAGILAALVAERMRGLWLEVMHANEQLRRANEALVDRQRSLKIALQQSKLAVQAKGQFLANMSHELRTPMTAILGYAELLDDPDLGAEQRTEHLDTIQRNGQHLLHLINDILDLSRAQVGAPVIELGWCSPFELIDDAILLMRQRASVKGLDFDVEYDGPLPEQIHTDATRLRQILLNLLGNAIKFTSTGEVKLRVGILEPERDPAEMIFEARDTGIGVAREHLQRIFEPFTQADASTTREYGGTGLGLAISHELAELLGGELSAESEPGRGSTFALRLPIGAVADVPRVPAEDRAELPREAMEIDETLFSQPLEGTVLVAEDSADTRRLLTHVLARCGLDVDAVGTGEEARAQTLARAEEGRPYDLVIMDMQMPDTDGYTATRRIRRAGYAGTIVALTAHAMAQDRDRCLACGCDDYATKPVSPSAICKLAATHVGKPRDDT